MQLVIILRYVGTQNVCTKMLMFHILVYLQYNAYMYCKCSVLKFIPSTFLKSIS